MPVRLRSIALRLIPACAGKTPSCSSCASLRRAHPRVCGENCFNERCLGTSEGSSPRVRGKPGIKPLSMMLQGLIPACAGKTPVRDDSTAPGRAHPRVCGENRCFLRGCGTGGGSSPRVRGKLRQALDQGRDDRLIPACAGKTRGMPANHHRDRAHPRVCGENGLAGHLKHALNGSSPRVRGKL